jgi:hypothetical protein
MFDLTVELINAIFIINIVLLLGFAFWMYRFLQNEEKAAKKNG